MFRYWVLVLFSPTYVLYLSYPISDGITILEVPVLEVPVLEVPVPVIRGTCTCIRGTCTCN